jgi:hypothetical protein
MDYFVSNFDILNLFPDAKIKTFSELDKYNTIYDLMPNKIDYVFILTESEKNKGHWTLLMRREDTFSYFDSYGNSPKIILSFTPKFMNKYLGNDWNQDLGKMIKSIKGKRNFSYNRTAFQNIKNPKSATCGRWCIYRLFNFLMESLDSAQFLKKMMEQKQISKLSYDETIVILVPI